MIIEDNYGDLSLRVHAGNMNGLSVARKQLIEMIKKCREKGGVIIRHDYPRTKEEWSLISKIVVNKVFDFPNIRNK